jgi:ribosomal protein S18 acetylase RimI-like enzyme
MKRARRWRCSCGQGSKPDRFGSLPRIACSDSSLAPVRDQIRARELNRIDAKSIQWIVSDVQSKVMTRLYAEGDLPALYAVETVCFEAPVRFSRGLMRSLVHDPNCRTWLGLMENVRVGFAIVGVREQGDSVAEALTADGAVADGLVGPSTAYIWTIEVLPAFRRLGVARQLLLRMEESASEASCAAIELHVSERNSDAVALYQGAGFVRFGVEPEFYGREENAIRYRKVL